MSIKTTKPKATASKGTASKNGRSANGTSPKTAKSTKSINERWIEKYGVDDSESARKTLEMWQMIYDAHNKPKS